MKEVPKERICATFVDFQKVIKNYHFFKINKVLQVCLTFFLSILDVKNISQKYNKEMRYK